MHWRRIIGNAHGLAVLLAILALGSFGVFERYASGAGSNAARIVRAVDLASGEAVTLPARWRMAPGAVSVRHFRLTFQCLGPLPSELAIYLPRFEQRLQLELNGSAIPGGVLEDRWGGAIGMASGLVRVPRERLRAGENVLTLTLETGPAIYGSLGPVLAGDPADLVPRATLRRFFEHELKTVIFGMEMLVALLCTILALTGRGERGFGWLALSAGTACVFSLGIFAPLVPLLAHWTPQLFSLSVASSLGLLGFMYFYVGRREPRFFLPVVAAVAVAPVAIAASPADPGQVLLFLLAPLILASLLACIVLAAGAVRENRRADLVFIYGGLLALTAGTLRDTLVREGVLDGVTLWTRNMHPLILLGVVGFAMYRYVARARRVASFSSELATSLAAREEELRQLFREEREKAQWIAAEKERLRIISELHDGVASQLVSIVALSESAEDMGTSVRDIARDALRELRLVIDTTSSDAMSLDFVLGAFRERCLGPVERTGLQVTWAIGALPPVQGLTPAQAQDIMRILQEALANALRHGEPDAITVSGRIAGNRVELGLENSGGRSLAEGTGGRGMENSRRRAAALGGAISHEAIPGGTRVRLSFPLPGAAAPA